jgi:hypothetical protein
MSQLKFFENLKIPKNKLSFWQFGELCFWIKSLDEELWVATKMSETLLETPPEDIVWERWPLPKEGLQLQFKPLLPKIPIVVRMETPFRLISGAHSRIFIRLPVWVGLALNNQILLEKPSLTLSKTWFGSFTTGELCYAITTAARKTALFEDERPFLVVSPISIDNTSTDELLVDKFCHRVNRLNLFMYENKIWTNDTRIQFKGSNVISDIHYSKKPPSEIAGAKIVTPARIDGRRSLTERTFDTIVEITKFEFFR